MSPLDVRSFARKKFAMIEAAGSDPDLPSSLFRLLLCVLDRVPEGSDTTALGDDYLRDECPGYRRDGSLRKARSALQRIGYWRFTPGSGRAATSYTILWDRVSTLLAQRKARAKIRQERRDERDEAFRALARVRRGEFVPTPGKIDPPSSFQQGGSRTPPLDLEAREGIKSVSPQIALLRGGKNDPPFNSSTSIEEAYEKEVLSHAHARERVLSLHHFDVAELDLAAAMIGNGDPGRGYQLLALHEDDHIRACGDQLDEAGAERSTHQIQAMRVAALRIEQEIERRAANGR